MNTAKLVAALAALSLIGCGAPAATRCNSWVFGQGIDSVLPIDCGAANGNAELAVQYAVKYAHLDETTFRDRMRHVHVEIHSVASYKSDCGFGDSSEGEAAFNQIGVNEFGLTLEHETLHAYDLLGDLEHVDTFFKLPVEISKEMKH